MVDDELKKDLVFLQGKRIFFGHQSVGVNIMQGIRDLCAEANDVRINFVSSVDSVPSVGPFFADSQIGKNNDPRSKCDAFSGYVHGAFHDSLDVAIMKFCYVDVTPTTDVEEIYRYYLKTMDSLKSACPQTVFVPVTMPYAETTSSWRVLAKKLIGREDPTRPSNLNRTHFNEMVLEHFRGEPLFDLGRVESTYPDGRRESFDLGGRKGFSLVPEYTYDGGHLNALGRKIAAREMIHILAGSLRAREKSLAPATK